MAFKRARKQTTDYAKPESYVKEQNRQAIDKVTEFEVSGDSSLYASDNGGRWGSQK